MGKRLKNKFLSIKNMVRASKCFESDHIIKYILEKSIILFYNVIISIIIV